MKNMSVRRRSVRHAVEKSFEMLEGRRLLTSTPWVLTAGSPLTQNWESVDFTAADTWPMQGIEGLGIAGTSTTPSSITAATPAGTLKLNINQTNPNSYSTAGNTEFELASPIIGTRPDTSTTTTGSRTIAFQGSSNGTFGTPFLKFYIDSTGLAANENVRIKYDLIDIDAGTATSDQAVALQYRTSPTAAWTNLSAGFTASAGPIGATAGKATLVDVTLPSDARNQSGLEIRIITNDSAGSDQLIAIENIEISAFAESSGPGVISFGSASLTTTEAAGVYNLQIDRTGGTTGDVGVTWTITPGSAGLPADFTTASGLLTGTATIPNGQNFVNVPITIVNDTLVEGTESFGVALSSPTGGATLGAITSTTVSITDNDSYGAGISFNPTTYTVSEADGQVTLTIQRFGGTAGPITVPFTVTPGTATTPSDYTTTSGVFTFADGANTATAVITLVNDSLTEAASESFTVDLGTPSNGTLSGSNITATVNISDDDISGGVLAFNPTSYSVNEADGTVTLTVKRTLGSSGAVSATWTTNNDTATSPGDFTGGTGTVNFADGVDTATIVIPLTNDSLTEVSESFTVTLSSPQGGAVLGTGVNATVSITDDDNNAPTGIYINEITINTPGNNVPYSYVELRGPANTTLSNVYLLSIEGDSNASNSPGQLDRIIDLSGAVFGSNGLLIIKAASNTSGVPDGFVKPGENISLPEVELVDPATGVFGVAFFNTVSSGGSGFETGSNSFVLIYHDPSGAPLPTWTTNPTTTTDLDLDNTPTSDANLGLEGLPSSVTVLDAVGQLDGNTTDRVYGAQLAPVPSASNTSVKSPGGIVRFTGNNTRFDASAFYYGIIAGTAEYSTNFTTNVNDRSTNFPEGGVLTPGSINAPVPSDTTPPTLDSVQFVYNPDPAFNPVPGQYLLVNFSEDVRNATNDVLAADFSVVRSSDNAEFAVVVDSISSDGKQVKLRFTGTGGISPSTLQDGRYVLRVKSGQIADLAGNATTADIDSTQFAFKNADLDGNLTVNFNDLLALARNYNKASGARFSEGDANYDGAVTFNDLLALARNYNQSLPALTMSVAAKSAVPATTRKSGAGQAVLGTATAIV